MARETFLSTNEDRKWLREVHKIDIKKPQVAILIGNEDCPDGVKVYDHNHVDSPYQEWQSTYIHSEFKLVRGLKHSGIPATK